MSQATAPTDPAIIVIFGVSGDLSHRYLLPSLYHLLKDNLLNQKTRIVGLSRRQLDKTVFFKDLESRLSELEICDRAVLKDMAERTALRQLDMESAEEFSQLLEHLNQTEDQLGVCLNRLYYLSIPPQAQQPVIERLGRSGLNQGCQHGQAESRLLIEKPFGYDLSSAQNLIREISNSFQESQIYRIDHYLAKETVQNILTFRFKNPVFEALWSNQYVASIEILAKEQIGIEGRAAFYEPLGAIRDFIQSHLIHILGLLLMKQPSELKENPIHQAKHRALAQIRPVDPKSHHLVRGQYEAYKQEVNNPLSKTETYADLTVYSSDPRWQGVPLRLYSGKALDEKRTQASVNFKSPSQVDSNSLTFRIQPKEGIEFDLVTKKPGFDYSTEMTTMDFSYQSSFGPTAHPNAYEKVLIDAIRGDRTLFATAEEVIEAWRIVEPALKKWQTSEADLIIYKPGSKKVRQING